MKYAVVTTFNAPGLKQYGQRMVDAFEQLWPADVDLIVCAENCDPVISRANTRVLDLLGLDHQLQAFVDRHRNNPQAHGQAGPARAFDPTKSFKWDAVRFCYKIYSIKLASSYINHGWLIWLDADTVTHSPVQQSDLEKLCPADSMISYLGRGENYHSECGWVGYNLDYPKTQNFINDLVAMYDQDRIFDFPEWHDSYVWDVVRKQYQNNNKFYNLTHTLPKPGRAGHPFINSDLGKFMDHMKGNRKQQGRSKQQDLVVSRSEAYWNLVR
jgi:hypothetical protein